MTRPTTPERDSLASELPDDEHDRMARDYTARLDDDGDPAWLRHRDRWVAAYFDRQPQSDNRRIA